MAANEFVTQKKISKKVKILRLSHQVTQHTLHFKRYTYARTLICLQYVS